MDHSYIDEHQVAERYLMGRLSPEEAERFEEHSLGCAECIDRLEAAEGLRLGLRDTAAVQAAGAAVQLGLLARLARSRAALWGLAALLLAVLLPSGLLLREVGERDRELADARAALAARKPAGPDGTPAPSPADGSEIDALRARAAELESRAAEDRAARERLAAELSESHRPLVNLPVVQLAPERSGAAGPGGPSTRVSLAAATPWVVFALEVDPGLPRYNVLLLAPKERVSEEVAGLRPDALGNLSFALHRSVLAPGDYTLRVEGLPAQGEPVPLGDLAFRVVP